MPPLRSFGVNAYAPRKNLPRDHPAMKLSALHRYSPLFTALLLSVLVAGLYGHTLHAPWYFDDENAILGNPQTTDLGQALSNLFTQRGVTLFSFALNYNLGGGFSLPAFHLVNIVIHLLCGWLVYLLLRRVFPERLLWPLCGAMLFLAHPLQTQAVTYIVQRMTTLSALFFLLALYLFVRAREALGAGAAWRSRAHLAPYLGALVAGALALGAKETAAVLPLALLLFSRFILPRTEGWRPLLLSITPFLLAPLLLGAVMLLLPLAHDAALVTLTRTQPLTNLAGNTPLRYLFTEFSVFWIYLRLILLPYGQALEHGYPVVRSLFTFQTMAAAAGLLVLAGLGWRLRRIRPRITFGIAWFFLTLAIESTLIPLDPLFEHRLYLPLLGVLVVLLDLAELIPWRQLSYILLGLALLVCALLTWRRNALWNDTLAFYEDNLRNAPATERVLIELSSAYINAGQCVKAEVLALKSLAMNPAYPYSYRNLARIYLDMRLPTQAKRYIDAGLKFQELRASAEIYNLLSRAQMLLGRPDLALNASLTALNIRREAMTYNNLGAIYKELNRWPEAEVSFRTALALDNADPLFHVNLAQLLRDRERLPEALTEYNQALRLAPQRDDLRREAAQIANRLGQPF